MLDGRMRPLLAPALDATAAHLSRAGVAAGAVTGAGLVIGIGACAAAALEAWIPALGLFAVNRVFDGLDGPIARARGASDLGGLLDFLADYVVYAGFPVAVAVAVPDARVAVAALLASYLLNVVALLSLSSLAERRNLDLGDERSLRFTTGLAEGTETIACYAFVCLVPEHAGTIFLAFTAVVLITVGQRLRLARAVL